MAVEFGMGTDLRGEDYTKAACRALQDALWHNSLTVCQAFDRDLGEMIVHINIAVDKPEEVDINVVASVLPYGKATVEVSKGGLNVPGFVSPADQVSDNVDARQIVIANAAAIVYLNFSEENFSENKFSENKKT